MTDFTEVILKFVLLNFGFLILEELVWKGKYVCISYHSAVLTIGR